MSDKKIEIGYIIKTHGVKGALKVKLYDEVSFDVAAIQAIFIDTQIEKMPFFIESFQYASGNLAFIKLEELDSKEEAHTYKGCKLFLKEDEVTIQVEENSSHAYINYLVKDKIHGDLGKVEDVYEFPHQDLLSITYKSKEVLIPFRKELMENIDEKEKIILFNLPEGFLEL